MPAPHPPELRERARVLVTTTTMSFVEIAAELGISQYPVRRWTKEHGWERPPETESGPRRRVPLAKYPAMRRIYEGEATLDDIAVLAGCSVSLLSHNAAQQEWRPRRQTRRAERASAPQLASPEVAALEAALRDPNTSRSDHVRILERLTALTAADMIATGEPPREAWTSTLNRLTAVLKSLPADVAAPPHRNTHAPEDHFPDANDLIEEIARRVEAMGNEWLHPRVLAALAETIA
jgi:hypothetical protein